MRYFFSSRRVSFLTNCNLVGTSCWHEPSPSLLFSTRSHRVLTEPLNPTQAVDRANLQNQPLVGLPRCITPGQRECNKRCEPLLCIAWSASITQEGQYWAPSHSHFDSPHKTSSTCPRLDLSRHPRWDSIVKQTKQKNRSY